MRGWIFHPLVLVGLLFGALVAISALGHHRKQAIGREAVPSEQGARIEQVLPPRTTEPRRATQVAPQREPNPKRQEWREEKNLEAQRQTAKWAKWAAVASVIAAFAAVFGVLLVWKTLKATQEMVGEARKTTLAAEKTGEFQTESYQRLERPYLYLHVLDVKGLTSDVMPQLTYYVANYGRTPALLTSISVGLYDHDDWVNSGTTGAIEQLVARPIGPGQHEDFDPVTVTSKSGRAVLAKGYEGSSATLLVLIVQMTYVGHDDAIHTDYFRFRGVTGGKAFRIDDGPQPIRRETRYPSPKQA